MKFVDKNNITPKFTSSIDPLKVLWGIYQIGEVVRKITHFPVLSEMCIPMIVLKDIPNKDDKFEIVSYELVTKCAEFNTYLYIKED